MSFELNTPQLVELTHVQTRPERHGDDIVDALDMHVSWVTSSHDLDLITNDLRGALFCAKPSDDEQTQESLLEQDSEPYLRLPTVQYPLKLEGEQKGMLASIQIGAELIYLNDCTVKKFRVTPIEGGSAQIDFLIQCNHNITRDISGLLDVNQQRKISLTLRTPDEVQHAFAQAADVDGDVVEEVSDELADVMAQASARHRAAFEDRGGV